MRSPLTLYAADWVMPVTAPPFRDGVVAVDGAGTIQYVGPRVGAPSGALYDLGVSLLMPGLVNTHSHLELTAMRNFLEGLSFSEWIVTLNRSRQAVLSNE